MNSNPSLRIDFDKHEAGKVHLRNLWLKWISFVLGKIIYQLSPIDEEIKKPLVLETLKLALPKKKLDTM